MLRGVTERVPDLAGGDQLLVGLAEPDDAAVYRLGGGRVLIATVDFFTPIVDDPFAYGQVAAANSISDVYAMGGDPFLALSVAAFPADLPPEILTEVLAGAATKVREAGAVLAGGHSVRDAEPKFGLTVLGFAREDALILKRGARPGDLLYLTKPLGTGVLATALKEEALSPDLERELVASMARLSGGPSRAAVAAGVHGGTDVTGYALAGHALEMAEASVVRVVLEWGRVPLLPSVHELAAQGFVPGGTGTNEAAFAPRVSGLDRLSETDRALLFDPQTSGGLLLAVPPAREAVFRAGLAAEAADGWRIGRVEAGAGLALEP